MTTNSNYAIIEYQGSPPANSLMIGPLDTIMQWLPDTVARNDEIKRLDAARFRADEIQTLQERARGIQVAAFCDAIRHITRRLDAFEQRRAERARRDTEEREREEQRLIEDALSKLPDPNLSPSWATGTVRSTMPDGELTTHEPSEPKYEEQLEATPDNEGDLPNELLEDVPPVTGTDPNLSGSREPTARNPVALSFSDKRGDLAAATRLPPPPISADSLYPTGYLGTFFIPDPIPSSKQ